jgi:hypothetical protein
MEKILFFDIETVANVPSYDQLSPQMQKLRDKKSLSLRDTSDATSAELFIQRAGIYSEFGKIVCIVC